MRTLMRVKIYQMVDICDDPTDIYSLQMSVMTPLEIFQTNTWIIVCISNSGFIYT